MEDSISMMTDNDSISMMTDTVTAAMVYCIPSSAPPTLEHLELISGLG